MAVAGRAFRIGTAGVAGVLAGTLLTACGSEGDASGGKAAGASAGASSSAASSSSASSSSPSAREGGRGASAVRGAYERTAEAGSARLKLKVTSGAEGQSFTAQGQGAIDLDGGASTMTVTAAGQRIEQRVVEQILYQKLPVDSEQSGGKPWIKIDLKRAAAQGLGGQGIGDPAQSAAYAKAISDKDVTEAGPERIDGVNTTRYHVTVDVGRLTAGKALEQQLGSTMPMDVWLDDEGRIRRQRTDMTVEVPGQGGQPSASASAQPLKVSTLMEFSDFGTEVRAEAPPAGQVTDMTDKVLRQQ
ncbi:hypothetical protein [Streptomyces ziwulingensis]|uniref:Lipoprotein n=1 Tax=Streptomyces ziwulingensis TaxID=1045501 RepID=A0ABP9BT93_9ACTN